MTDTWHNCDDRLPSVGQLVEVKYLSPGMTETQPIMRLEKVYLAFFDGKRKWVRYDNVVLPRIEPIYWRAICTTE